MADKKSSIGQIASVRGVSEYSASIPISPGTPADTLLEHMKNMQQLHGDDIKQQLEWRPKVLKFTARVLLLQNITILALVFYALHTNKMKDLSLVFSTLLAGTLLQTAYIAKVMVRFLFKDIDYQDKEYDKWYKHIK